MGLCVCISELCWNLNVPVYETKKHSYVVAGVGRIENNFGWAKGRTLCDLFVLVCFIRNGF